MDRHDASSSSDFSSDEEADEQLLGSSYSTSLTPRVVEIEVLDDPEEAEISDRDAAELLASLHADGLPDALVQALAPVLAASSYVYDAYTTALYDLSQLWPQDASAGAHRTLRRTRAELYRRFHRAFPLTPDMYSEYIASVDAVPHKLRLYAQAARDYVSVPLAMDHLRLLAENEDVVPGVAWEPLQAAMDAALRSVGGHYTQGSDLWTLVRELTTQHFDEADDSSDGHQKEAALRELFTRQMRLPLQQNDLAMSEFRAWNQYNTRQDEATRRRAIDAAEQFQQRVFGGAVYKKLNQFEARLAAALSGTVTADAAASEVESPEKVWTQYLNYAQFKLAPLLASPREAREYVVGLHERAVASVCLSSALWSKYAQYVASTDTVDVVGEPSEQLQQVFQRATRNVSFDSAFWIEWLLTLEARGNTRQQISATIETELLTRTAPPLMDAAHMARVLTTYCSIVRRLASESVDAVDTAIARCTSFAETAFSVDAASPVAALLAFQAQVYAFRSFRSAGASVQQKWRDVWHEMLRIRGDQAETWLSFYEEYRFVHSASASLIQELRDAVFTPAFSRVRDYPGLILEKWLAFESSVGDRESYLRVHERYQTLVQQLQYSTTGQTTAPTAAAATTTEKAVPQQAKKRKAEKDAVAGAQQPAPTKRQKPAAAQAAPPIETAKKSERFTNNHTLFVCNLSKDVTKEELHALFAPIATLRDVRLVVKERANHVKSRGMAYVQFSDDAGVVDGLALDGSILHGQAMKVERSLPPTGKTSKPVESKAGKATTTLYVGGLLPPDRAPITGDEVKAALVEVLGDGTVKQVLILTDRKGKPKEYGLVEVADAALVDAAVKKQHELKLKLGDQATVQTSRMTIDQVVRHRDEQKLETQKAKLERQQLAEKTEKPPTTTKKVQAKTAPHATPNPRLAVPAKPVASTASLMPRALRKKTLVMTAAPTSGAEKSEQPSTKPPAETGTEPPAAPKTNADFRKLFLS